MAFFMLFDRAGSVHGIKRVIANRYTGTVVRPGWRDGGSGEMISLRHQHAALGQGQFPVVDGIAGDPPCLGESIQIVDFERA